MKMRMQKRVLRALMMTTAAVLCEHAVANETQASTDEDWLREVIVTAPRMQSPLLLILDAKAPRQPLPAHDGADYLKTVPGFSVIRKGGADGDPVFRGMAASRVNLQMDGEQILGGCGMRMDPPTAYVFPETYDRIVIIKGPQTVLHGPGNSAATVLFERDPPGFRQGQWRLHSSAVAAADRSDFVADLLLGDESFYGRVSGTRAEADDYEDGAGRTVHSRYRRWSANAELGWTPDENTRMALTAAQSDGEAAYADRAMDGVMFARDNVGLRFERDYGGEVLRRIEAQVFYNYVDHVMDNYSLRTFTPSMMMPNQAVSNPDRRTTGGRLAVELGKQHGLLATVGMDAQENVHTIRSTRNQALAPYQALARVEDGKFRNAGVFGEITWPLSDAQRVVSGVRVDHWEARDSRATLNIGMGPGVENPSAGQRRSKLLTSGFGRWEHDSDALNATFYAGIGHVERFPDYWELLSADRESVDAVNAFNTRPERTTQLDTGFVYRSSGLEFSLAAFYSRIDDYILIQSGFAKGMRTVSVTRNVDAATLGAEAGAAYALGAGWKLTGALAYTRGENETDDVPLAQLSPLEARLGVNYERDVWSVGMLARWVADQDRFALNQGNIVGQDLGPTDGFATLAINASWRPLQEVLLSAGIDNLFNRLHAEHLSRGGAMLAGYTQTTRVNEPGRTLWLRLSADFK